MRYAHILEIVHHQPWLITPSSHASISRLLDSKLAGIKADLAEDFGLEIPQMEITADGLALIPVMGVLGKGLSQIEKSCGAMDTTDIEEMIGKAEADPNVKGVLFVIDSPGGSVSGIPELGRVIASMKKNSVAWIDGMACSAAYWIASQCDAIYGSESSVAGSIGVYMPWMDQTRRYEANGVKVDIIKNSEGTYKAAGYPGTALTEEQRANLQASVDQVFAMFSSAVTSKRKRVQADTMRGQTFMGSEAFNVGLIDGVVTKSQAASEALR